MPARRNFFFLSFFFLLNLACNQKPSLESIKDLTYPSGSGIEFFNNHIYLIGDDAPYLIKLDGDLDSLDTIQLFPNLSHRLPKETKADLESMAVMKAGNTPCLLVLGSGSLPPLRNKGWLINPATGERIQLDLSTFYRRLRIRGIDEINIEGVARAGNSILLVNRGNRSHRANYLVLTSPGFLGDPENAGIRLIRLGTQPDTSSFMGVSGIDYSGRSDRLVLTVSTENTFNSYEDGAIGKSYLWIIHDFTSKTRMTGLNPNEVIDLETIDARFKHQKVESVTILAESKSSMELLLVADNDDGKTVLFRINLPK